MRVAICDDEREIAEQMMEYLEADLKKLGQKADIRIFSDAADFRYDISEAPPYDIIFLDIEVGDENGIHLAEVLKEKDPAALVIFMTGHYHYVFDVFDVQPFGFLKKPLRAEEVERVFEKAVSQSGETPFFEYSKSGYFYRIRLQDICYFESNKRQICLSGKDGEQSFYGKMDEVEQKVQEQSDCFLRVSQSVLININFITEINYYTATVVYGGNKKTFNVSQKYQVQVRKRCLEMWKV